MLVKKSDFFNRILILLISITVIINIHPTISEKYSKIYAILIFFIMLYSIVIYGQKIKKISLFLILYGIYIIYINYFKGVLELRDYQMIIVIFFIFWCSNLNLNSNHFKILFISFLLLFLFFLLKSINYWNLWVNHTLNNYHPNYMGIIIMLSSLYIIIFIKILNFKYIQLWSIIIIGLTVWGIYSIKSRAALMGIFSYIIFEYIFPKKFWRKKQKTLIMLVLIILFSILYTYAFLKLNNILSTIDLSLMTGKSALSGRNELWKIFYSEICSNPFSFLFGFEWAEDLNLHNNSLGMITRSGIIGLIFYYFYIINIILVIYKKQISNLQINFVIIFFSFLIHQLFEQANFGLLGFVGHLSLAFAISLNSENDLGFNLNRRLLKTKNIELGKVK